MYMAPEVLAYKPYSFKADIWSVGVTLFEMLTGHYPFQGSTKGELYKTIRTGQYQISTEHNLSE